MIVSCINLERRTDRWARCQQIEREHPGIKFVRSHAFEMPGRGWIGCSLGHQLAVYEAKIRDEPHVWVAEDDVQPTAHFDVQTLERIAAYAAQIDVGILTTGTVSYAQEIVNDHHPLGLPAIVETQGPMSTQLVCYQRRAYDAVLHFPIGWGSDWNVDPSLPGELHDRMRCKPPILVRRAVTIPFLTTQVSDFSDSCGRVMDLDQNWKDAEESWNRALAQNTHRHRL